MKLQAGNPNLMRVNPDAGLGALPNKLGDKNPAKYVRGGYVPMQKDPDAVPPPQMSIWDRKPYVPEDMTPARRGADDFLRIQSRGF
jgi:hypothetical protein